MDTNTAADSGTWEPSPRLTIVVHSNGRAGVGGVPVVVSDGAGLAAVRAAAMRTAVDIAVRRGGPVRALALEPDGSAWPLVIHPDGRVEEDTAEPEAPPSPQEAATPVETPAAPEQFRDRLARIAEAGEAGRVEAAAALAAGLEREAGLRYGPAHPHVLQARAVRAHVSVLARDWVRAADLYLGVAADWRRRSSHHNSQIRRNATNAHYCWQGVTDPADSLRIGAAVVRMWFELPLSGRELTVAQRRYDELRRRLNPGR